PEGRGEKNGSPLPRGERGETCPQPSGSRRWRQTPSCQPDAAGDGRRPPQPTTRRCNMATEVNSNVLSAVRELQQASDDEDKAIKDADLAAAQLASAQQADRDAKAARDAAHKAVTEKFDAAVAALKSTYILGS